MSHLLHIHIISASRRVVTGLEVLLMASGMVGHVSVQDPKSNHHHQQYHRRPNLLFVDTSSLALLPPHAVLNTVHGTVPWCALVHNEEQRRQATTLGATYLLSPGFAAESLFSIVARCLREPKPHRLGAISIPEPCLERLA